jgi:hypothetical protein
MSILTISADLPNLESIIKSVSEASQGHLKFTEEAVRTALTDVIQRTWIEYASGVQVHYSGGSFVVHTVSGEYVRSIAEGLKMDGNLSGEIVTTSPHGAIVEDGIKAYDMKVGLLNSPKAKTGKGGSLYITVPFRHGTPGTATMPSMSRGAYKDAKKLGYSRRNNALTSGMGTQYTWGGRLKNTSEGKRSKIISKNRNYTWKTGLFSGMVKMGKRNHTQYMTFRRVSANSDPNSWQFPDVPARPIRVAVIENTREEVLQLIRNGFEMDLYFMGIGGD